MIDVVDIQEALRRDPELIIAVLENLGYEHIRDRGDYITFPNLDGDNMGACCIYKNTLNYNNFSRGESGNIFSLVMDKRECSFPRALRSICTWAGIVATETKGKICKPFGGFYEQIVRNCANGAVELPKYDEALLPGGDSLSKKFLDDGIDLLTQEKWGVRFCHDDNCILIPIRDANGRLVGCKARNNDNNCTMDRRWWAWLPYQKTSVVYGLGENFGSVAKSKTVYVFESEKSVLQCASFGCHLAVAIAGHTISDTQARYIKGLMADRIVIAFDEGIDRYELEENAKKLISDNPAYQNRVGFIYDKDGELLRRGRKDSPSDLGRDVFEELVKKNILWMETEE